MYLIWGIPVLFFICWCIYLVKCRHMTGIEATCHIQAKAHVAWHAVIKCIQIYWLRKTVFQIVQDISPFEEAVKDLKVCKYFKYQNMASPDKDTTELHFSILGIVAQYKDNLSELDILLEHLLQDFYIERLGRLSYPFVYAAHIQEGEAVFLVANNAYGNELIQKRRYADKQGDVPNMEALEDD